MATIFNVLKTALVHPSEKSNTKNKTLERGEIFA